MQLRSENRELKEKLNEMTLMLYRKIEDNQKLTKRLEQNQMQHTVFLTKLLLSQQQQGQSGRADNLRDIIGHQLNKVEGGKANLSPSTFLNVHQSNSDSLAPTQMHTPDLGTSAFLETVARK